MQGKSESGQGLSEYAFVIALIAIIVIAVLALFGPQLNAAYDQVMTNVSQPAEAISGHVSGISVVRTGDGHGNDVVVTVTVSGNTIIRIVDSQSASTQTGVTCNGSCTVTLHGVGASAGTISVRDAAGGTRTAPYAAKL